MPAPKPKHDAMRLDQLKLWTIAAILARPGEIFANPHFSRADWQAIDRCADQHRLQPLLLDRLRGSWNGWSVPDAIRDAWERRSTHAAMRSLDRLGIAVEVGRTLASANIPCAVLKGGALGGHYGNPALRPMRDIDVLVSPAAAPAAFDSLLTSGLIRRAEASGAVHVDYAAHKHLEALWSPRRRVAVEVHTALVDRPRGQRDDDPLLQIDPLLAGRRTIKLGNHWVPVLGWAETMLHLIVHAVYDHQFNNGPLVLSDCALLARDPTADWDSFWQLAERGGRGAGARLIFAIIESVAPQLPAGAIQPGHLIDPALVEQCALLLLQNTVQTDAQGGWDRLFAQGSWRRRLQLAWGRAVLRSRKAGQHGASGNLALAWRMGRALVDPVQRRDIRRSHAVFGWLQNQA